MEYSVVGDESGTTISIFSGSRLLQRFPKGLWSRRGNASSHCVQDARALVQWLQSRLHLLSILVNPTDASLETSNEAVHAPGSLPYPRCRNRLCSVEGYLPQREVE